MKILLLILPFIMGCSLLQTKTAASRDERIINCTVKFLDKDLNGTVSYKICQDIYKRGE